MQYFRLSHAGLVLEEDGHSLFVDPGNFSTDDELQQAIEASAPIVGVVITHEHADHWTPEHLERLRKNSDDAPIFTTQATSEALGKAGITTGVRVVTEGDREQLGPFHIDFYGHRHELLHSSIPVVDNIGVRVNEEFAWGGDSLVRPPFQADLLGVPIGSPWSNLAQVMDFVLDSRPRRVYLTHDGMLSDRGRELYTTRVQACLDEYGGELISLPFKNS